MHGDKTVTTLGELRSGAKGYPVTSAEQVWDYSRIDAVTNLPKTLEQVNTDLYTISEGKADKSELTEAIDAINESIATLPGSFDVYSANVGDTIPEGATLTWDGAPVETRIAEVNETKTLMVACARVKENNADWPNPKQVRLLTFVLGHSLVATSAANGAKPFNGFQDEDIDVAHVGYNGTPQEIYFNTVKGCFIGKTGNAIQGYTYYNSWSNDADYRNNAASNVFVYTSGQVARYYRYVENGGYVMGNITNFSQLSADLKEVWGGAQVDISGKADKSYVDGQLSGKANKSEMSITPGTGDNADKTTITLKEGTSATVLTQHQDISGKVDVVDGKGLSTNDYTDEEKAKVDAAAAHADFAYEKLVGGGDSGNIPLVNGTWWVPGLTKPEFAPGTSDQYFLCNANNAACVPGDTFILTGSGGDSEPVNGVPRSYLWAFGNSYGTIIRHAEFKEERVEPYTVVAQEGEAFFYYTAKNRETHGSKVARNSLYKVGRNGIIRRVSDLENTVSDAKSVCKMFNVPVDLKKPNLKILDLGNSYTGDATHYLKNILDAAGITTGFSLYTCVRGGSSFSSWVNLYKKEDNATYAVEKQAGDNVSGVVQGQFSGLNNSWFIDLLKKDWDIIFIHNNSSSSFMYDEGTAGELTEYLRIIKTYCPQATIGFYLIIGHPTWYTYSSQTGDTSEERWQNIVKYVKWIKANYGIDLIIPYGTAVENLRMTSINPLDPVANDGETKTDFVQDGIHLSSGIGDYVAACTYFETLFAPRYNVTVLGNTFRKQDIVPTEDDITNYGDMAAASIVQINDANALLAQRAAILAVNDMFNLHNPETSTYFSQDVEEAGDNDSFIPKAGDTNSYMEYNPILPTVGTSAQRNAMILKSKDVGFQFFDTSLQKPVYVAAVSADGLATWVNATGAAESYMVTYNLTGVHLIEDKKSATASTNYSTTIEEDEGYALPSGITVKVNSVSLIPGTHYDYDSETGEIVILSTSVNGAIIIEATGADPNAQGGGGQNPDPSHEQQTSAWVFGDVLPATLN